MLSTGTEPEKILFQSVALSISLNTAQLALVKLYLIAGMIALSSTWRGWLQSVQILPCYDHYNQVGR